MLRTPLAARLRPHIGAAAPGMLAVALMLVWAIQDGGYDAVTWYWGALLLLAAVLAAAWLRRNSLHLSRRTTVALGAFALYVAWSYLSITWSESKGDALEGSNRALLYLLIVSLLVVLPWTPKAALITLTTFALGLGAIAIVLLLRLATSDHVGGLVIGGRLAAPTGYFNATAALFTTGALVSIALAARRELPAELRGALIATACAGLQLGLIVQSRGWLFTLPLIVIVGIVLVPDRLRVAAAASLPVIAALVPLRRLLHVFTAAQNNDLAHAAAQAGTSALILCATMFVAATLIASGESLRNRPPLSPFRRRWLGTAVVTLAIGAVAVGGTVATDGHPFRFIERQWNGFSQPTPHYSSQSHFADVGSGRYDFWRVALDAFAAHPVGGLGQDNFGDYYLLHGRTGEEPSWTHSLELRLLASTGIVGFLLFGVFLVTALRVALSARRGRDLAAVVAAAALLPLVDWLIHGSVDWFWEMPALAGPSLGFLGMAMALGEQRTKVIARRAPRRTVPKQVKIATGAVVLVACVVVLGFPYLSAREISTASSLADRNPNAALHDLKIAADLNPLSSEAGRVAGVIALESHLYGVAGQRFRQSIAEQPLGWLSWLGLGLSASELGNRSAAHHDFVVADRIDSRQPAVAQALARVYTRRPLTPDAAIHMLVVVQ